MKKGDDDELASFARSVSVVLVVRGPMQRERVLGLLRRLDLGPNDAEAAIRAGLARGVLVEEGARLQAGARPRPSPRAGAARR